MAKVTKEQFLAHLDDLRSVVEADDSLEGSLQYSALRPGGFEFGCFYRVGNSMGQGGAVFRKWEEPDFGGPVDPAGDVVATVTATLGVIEQPGLMLRDWSHILGLDDPKVLHARGVRQIVVEVEPIDDGKRGPLERAQGGAEPGAEPIDDGEER